MPGCESMASMTMDADQPALCHAHCDKDKQSQGADAPSVIAMTSFLAHGLGWRVADELSLELPHPQVPETGPPRGAPPLFITYLVLRN